MSRAATFLDKAAEQTGYELTRPNTFRPDRRLALGNGQSVDFVYRHTWSDEVRVRLSGSELGADELRGTRRLLDIAHTILERYNAIVADDKAHREQHEEQARREREERRRREREEREKYLADKEQRDDERRERLLTEFQGEECRVRVSGYRSTVKATVTATEKEEYRPGEGYVATGEYEPKLVFEYEGANAQRWPNTVEYIERFEIKIGSRYRLVWEDRPVKAEEMNRKRNTDKEYDGELDGEI